MGWRAVVAIALLSFPVACGGRVYEEPLPDQPVTPNQKSSSPDASTTMMTPSGGGGSSKDNLDGTVSLPACVKGKLVSEVAQSSLAAGCPYVYQDRCYTTKVKACACACPNKTGTVCSSDFPSSEGMTAVFCG
jgi:hypothetical protein